MTPPRSLAGLFIFDYMLPIEIENIRPAMEAEIVKNGAELFELLFRRLGSRSTLTFIVDKKGGVSIEDCARINRSLSLFLEENPVIEGSYYLEVNSPGLDRALKTEKDFLRVTNELIRVFAKEDTGRVASYLGHVLSVAEGVIELKILEKEAVLRLRLDSIVKATREIRMK